MNRSAILVFLLLFLQHSGVICAQEESEYEATIYFVRHAETAAIPPSHPLAPRGFERAAQLVRMFENVDLTNVLATHTLRTRQTVQPVAGFKGLQVVPFPALGSTVQGQLIDDNSDSTLAIEPLANAIKELPSKSRVLVGVNSNNAFAIMNQLGVPVATADKPCGNERTCVPCLENTCFPNTDGALEYDNLWVLFLRGENRKPELIWLRYGSSN